MARKRFAAGTMGREIGTAGGWDQIGDFAVMFRDMTRNDIGRKFAPDFADGGDLCIDFERGVVSVYDSDGNETRLAADWSVFNV